jgi:hypothetical protein
VNRQLSVPLFPAIARAFGYLDVLHVARCVGFVAAVLIIWVSIRPLPVLREVCFLDVV